MNDPTAITIYIHVKTENAFHVVSIYYYASMPILRTIIAYSITSLYSREQSVHNVHVLTHVAKAFHAVSVLCPVKSTKMGKKRLFLTLFQSLLSSSFLTQLLDLLFPLISFVKTNTIKL